MNEELRRRMEAHRTLPQKLAEQEEQDRKARIRTRLVEEAWFNRMKAATEAVWLHCVDLLTSHGYIILDRPVGFKGQKVVGEMSVKSPVSNRVLSVRLWLDPAGYVFRLRGLEHGEHTASATLTEEELKEQLLDLCTRPFVPFTATG